VGGLRGSDTQAAVVTGKGFVLGQDLNSATTGTLQFMPSAPAKSHTGKYEIDGSGLTANDGNYVFVQALANLTALTIVH
jgi:hypothetical protein